MGTGGGGNKKFARAIPHAKCGIIEFYHKAAPPRVAHFDKCSYNRVTNKGVTNQRGSSIWKHQQS
jgi:hypothetical protein